MSERFITATEIALFVCHLRDEEREANTIEKYLRNIEAFAAWLGDRYFELAWFGHTATCNLFRYGVHYPQQAE